MKKEFKKHTKPRYNKHVFYRDVYHNKLHNVPSKMKFMHSKQFLKIMFQMTCIHQSYDHKKKTLITCLCQKLSSFLVIVMDDECMSSEKGIFKLFPFS